MLDIFHSYVNFVRSLSVTDGSLCVSVIAEMFWQISTIYTYKNIDFCIIYSWSPLNNRKLLLLSFSSLEFTRNDFFQFRKRVITISSYTSAKWFWNLQFELNLSHSLSYSQTVDFLTRNFQGVVICNNFIQNLLQDSWLLSHNRKLLLSSFSFSKFLKFSPTSSKSYFTNSVPNFSIDLDFFLHLV